MAYKNIDKRRDMEKRKYKKLVSKAICNLGGKCVLCGIDNVRVLQIDHVKPIFHTKEKRPSRKQLLQKINKGLKCNLQLLCANCHAIKTWG